MSTEMTLDPPGSIAVIGAGPLGIEAALYGRFLGYDVTLIEAVSVANSLRQQAQLPLPLPPDRSLSPLAVGALQAQFPELASTPETDDGRRLDRVFVGTDRPDRFAARAFEMSGPSCRDCVRSMWKLTRPMMLMMD